MSRTRHLLVGSVLAAGLALTATPAFAKGGGGGGGGGSQPAPTPTTEPAEPWALCPEFANGPVENADGTVSFANQITGVACVVIRPFAFGYSFQAINVAPGWTYSTKGSEGTKLNVKFENLITGEDHQIRVEPGKTVIR